MISPAAKRRRTESDKKNWRSIDGLFQCVEFISPNDFSEKTLGEISLLTRSFSGENPFFKFIDQSETEKKNFSLKKLISQLEDVHRSPFESEKTFEKRMILNRILSAIKKNPEEFQSKLNEIRRDNRRKLLSETKRFSQGFQQHQNDVKLRQEAVDCRRNFFFTDGQLKNPASVFDLVERTTEHLKFVFNQSAKDESFRSEFDEILGNIFETSFLIIDQPHCGVYPIGIFEKRKCEHKQMNVKISTRIVCLLNEFLSENSQKIFLKNLEVVFNSEDEEFSLEQPKTLFWQTCNLSFDSKSSPRQILFAEIESLIFQREKFSKKKFYFPQNFFTLNFNVEIEFFSPFEQKMKIYRKKLETMPFLIASNSLEINYLTASVIFNDIQRFARIVTVEILVRFLQRYFVFRTGSKPRDCVTNHLHVELNRVLEQRKHLNEPKEIFLDFLFMVINQIDFLGKNPVLNLFHSDGVFLSICNGDELGNILKSKSSGNFSLIGLRLNQIRSKSQEVLSNFRSKIEPCSVRATILKNSSKVENFTFEPLTLFSRLSSFVCDAKSRDLTKIVFISDWSPSAEISLSSAEIFQNYFDEKFPDFLREQQVFKPIGNIFNCSQNDDGQKLKSSKTADEKKNSPEQNFQPNSVERCWSNNSTPLGIPVSTLSQVLVEPIEESNSEDFHRLEMTKLKELNGFSSCFNSLLN